MTPRGAGGWPLSRLHAELIGLFAVLPVSRPGGTGAPLAERDARDDRHEAKDR
jgi:hypothetical protein